jgi:hypothetical protein
MAGDFDHGKQKLHREWDARAEASLANGGGVSHEDVLGFERPRRTAPSRTPDCATDSARTDPVRRNRQW